VTALLLFGALLVAHTAWAEETAEETAEPAAKETAAPDELEGPYTWGSAKNVMRLGDLWFAEQPDAIGFAAARDAGVEVVIDLRDPSERSWDEAVVVQGLGIEYHNVPITGATFDPAGIERIDSLVAANKDRQILLHCSSSNRVGGWLATHLVEHEDMPIEDALAIGRRAGITKPPVEERVRAYLLGQGARRTLVPLKQGLTTALQAALGESPQAAVEACRLAAPSITEAAQSETVRVGRTSHRTRNPENDPAPWMQPLLAHYLETPSQPRPPQIVDLGDEGTGYVEPIYLQQMCATCHGVEVDGDLLALIRERYPQDRAVGFMPGELRGLFWVVMQSESGPPPQR